MNVRSVVGALAGAYQALRAHARRAGLPAPGPAARPRLAAILLVVALLIVLGSVVGAPPGPAIPPPLEPGVLELRGFDVGQGDALFTRLDDATLLVDAGPDADTAATSIIPELRQLGVERVDFLVLTHADADHIGGAPIVMREFPVGAVIHADAQLSHPVMRDVIALAAGGGTAVQRVRRGDTLSWHPNVTITVLNPSDTGPNGDNDRSIVLRLVYRDSAILLPGDIEAAAERDLLSSDAVLRADILKVAHHGSAGSTTADFLDAVAPQIAVVSAGRHNTFGHPRDGPLSRLRERDVAVFRTDLAGDISVRTDGRAIQVLLERS